MTHLRIYLTDDNPPELERTVFQFGSTAEERESVRGKSAGAYRCKNTFQWTTALQALTMLCLRTAAQARMGQDCEIFLVGEANTPAASLDYAVGKPPVWLEEMFGQNLLSGPLVKRLIKRTNPERKRSGPVVLSFNQKELSGRAIEVCWRGETIECPDTLNRLADAIEKNWGSSDKKIASLLLPTRSSAKIKTENSFTKDGTPQYLRSIFREEILSMLRQTDIFQSTKLKQSLLSLAQNASFTQLVNAKVSVLENMKTELSREQRLGISDGDELKRYFSGAEPLRICVPSVQPSTIMLFTYLKHLKGCNIDLNFQFAYAVDLVQKIINKDFSVMPDVISIGVGPAAKLIVADTPYRPYMFMPATTHRIVAPKKSASQGINSGEYFFVTDNPTSASFYFDCLKREGRIHSNNICEHQMEPDESFAFLRQEGELVRSVQWFPHYQLNVDLNNCELIDEYRPDLNAQSMILFVHEKLYRQEKKIRALDLAIRDAWLDLKEGDQEFDNVFNVFFENREYMKFVRRCTGMNW